MKKIIAVIFIAITTLVGCKKKEEIKPYEVVYIQREQNIWLYSLTNIGGASAYVVPFYVPSNAIAVYYSVSTSSERKYPSEGLLLKQQLENRVLSPTFNPSDDLRFGIRLPSAPYSEPLNTYITDIENAQLFKSSNGNGYFEYLIEGSRQKIRQGVINITNESYLKGRALAVCLKNKNYVTGFSVSLEIVAIVKN